MGEMESMDRKRTVLVIGADGLLGSHLVRALQVQQYRVRVFKQPGSSSPTLDELDLEIFEGDLLDEGDSLAEAMQGCDTVFHLAAITDLWADEKKVWQVNYDGTRNVLDACLAAHIRRLIFTGSASSFQFGSMDRPGDERNSFAPEYRGIAYMESKHKAMELVLDYAESKGLDALVVAPTFMLGDLDWRPSSGELIRQFIARGMRVTSPGGRNFAHVSDVAQAMVNAIDKGKSGECYILGGENLRYLDFFTKVAAIAGCEPPKRVIPKVALQIAGLIGSLIGKLTGRRVALNRTLAKLSLMGTYYSSEKAIRELDMPQTPIESGIEKTIKSLLSYRHIYAEESAAFKGKVALITGASRGVGFSVARELVKRGAKVVLSARGERRLLDSRDKLERLGGDVAAVTGDVGKWDDARRMVEVAHDRFGKIDILVNNAGISMRGKFHELSPEVCTDTITTNLLGSVYLTKAAIDDIRETKGHVVFVSSIAGLFGLPGASTYCASKAALTGLSESLRLELIPEGVHSGVVYLGFTEHDPEKTILAADGTGVRPDRPAHHTQVFAASLIVDMLVKRKRRIIMTPAGVLGGLVYRFSPGFVEWAILKAQSMQIGTFKKFS